MRTRSKLVHRVDPAWLNEELGKRIRAQRERHGWTQGELAVLMGVTRVCVTNWESGRHQINFTLSNVYNLALIFGVPVEKLLP